MAKKILINDDEEIIIKSLAKLLEKKGYEVIVSKRGQDAVVIVEEEEFDLIISDIRMPGLNGVEAVKAIYKYLKKNNKVKPPVIFITGYADEKCEKEAQTLNPIGYLHKPFDIDDLMRLIKSAFNV